MESKRSSTDSIRLAPTTPRKRKKPKKVEEKKLPKQVKKHRNSWFSLNSHQHFNFSSTKIDFELGCLFQEKEARAQEFEWQEKGRQEEDQSS